MQIGVVSDTHNNLKNINKIISLFNKENVALVVHTGDICNAKSLARFSKLKCDLIGVYGNNDRTEEGIAEVADNNNFSFQEPPKIFSINEKNIAIFHEPDQIEDFLKDKSDIDIVLHGHTHRYRKEKVNNVLIFNPGESAGFLKGRNAVGLVNTKTLEVKRIFF